MSEKQQEKISSAGLVEEDDVPAEKDDFERQLEKTLEETERAVLDIEQIANSPDQTRSWNAASEIIKSFKPVPWFIWRLSNYVLGKSGQTAKVTEGFVYGLRRLLFAAASDPVLGTGEKVSNVRIALKNLDSTVIAAVSIIHAVCRRLKSMPHERIWGPILEDALLRARIGFEVGSKVGEFGAGRGMLAGFSGRAGLTILIATGDIDSARKALEMLATGTSIRDVGIAVYECDPLQVSVMILSASGCGRDASFGTVSYASKDPLALITEDFQLYWLAAYALCEAIRVGDLELVPEEYFEVFDIDEQGREELLKNAKLATRRGHGWQWLLG